MFLTITAVMVHLTSSKADCILVKHLCLPVSGEMAKEDIAVKLLKNLTARVGLCKDLIMAMDKKVKDAGTADRHQGR